MRKPIFQLVPALFAFSLTVISKDLDTTIRPQWLNFDWPEADQIFQKDPNWVGGDGGYSINLSNGRVLWLFGDSWINTRGTGSREGATMISNTLAIQRGYDPSNADIEFFHGGEDFSPEAFFPDSKGVRSWPGHGVLVQDRLLLFLNEVESTEEGIGFRSAGWSARLVFNPEDDPDKWTIRKLRPPPNDLGVIVGSGGVLVSGNHVYAFSSQEPGPKQDIYLVRWKSQDAYAGKLETMEWWCGPEMGWLGSPEGENSVPVFENGQTEFTVHFDKENQLFVETQTVGFGKATIVQRTASELTGPWSKPVEVYNPEQNKFNRIMIYQGKSHPHLLGADQVITYCTNSFEFGDHFDEPWLYYPRFVRINSTEIERAQPLAGGDATR